MFEYSDYKIILCCGATDMRKSINGLCDLVQFKFELDPREKVMFVFCNISVIGLSYLSGKTMVFGFILRD